ncbi:hypothetical protein CDL15_Pgr021233 [Punica granatum]|uniref:Uncharacterized protein n=1 Tax=Punica granatum TaxID=22663 RepID=A0A218WSD6_PUNGR|nr:hypothetical protein CDL15_Pgr021233 [Punica granatum]PKI68322.1 hypothetical protein CRG98_011230 [Punica granatum]
MAMVQGSRPEGWKSNKNSVGRVVAGLDSWKVEMFSDGVDAVHVQREPASDVFSCIYGIAIHVWLVTSWNRATPNIGYSREAQDPKKRSRTLMVSVCYSLKSKS